MLVLSILFLERFNNFLEIAQVFLHGPQLFLHIVLAALKLSAFLGKAFFEHINFLL